MRSSIDSFDIPVKARCLMCSPVHDLSWSFRFGLFCPLNLLSKLVWLCFDLLCFLNQLLRADVHVQYVAYHVNDASCCAWIRSGSLGFALAAKRRELVNMTLIHYASGDTRDASGHQGLGFILHETELFGASCGGINGAFFAHRGDASDRYVEFRVQTLRPANNCFAYVISNHWVNEDIR